MNLENLLVLDNVLDDLTFEKALKLAKNELLSQEEGYLIAKDDKFNDRSYKFRSYPPNGSEIANIAENMLWGDKVTKAAANLGDLSWKLFNDRRAGRFEVQITKYSENDQYGWHVDHQSHNRILNYILYLEAPEEGGHLEISNDCTQYLQKPEYCSKPYNVYKSIQPKTNRLAIMPSWLIHRVKPVIKGSRLTLNGHISI